MRIKRALIRRTRKRKLFKLAKGFYGRKKNVLRTATEAVHHALSYAFRDRRVRKRMFRRLWVVRVNAAVRNHGLSYSRFIHLLKQANVGLDRKVLANLAVENPRVFAQMVQLVQDRAGVGAA